MASLPAGVRATGHHTQTHRPAAASYQRYFRRGWAERDHGGHKPGVLFVFETPQSESAFLDVADATDGLDVITANMETLAEQSILGVM